MPTRSKKIDEVVNAVDEALTEISKDHTNILKALNKIADRLNELSAKLDTLDELYKLYEALEGKVMSALDDLEKIRKSLYWHRQTVEKKTYRKTYRYSGKKSRKR